MTVSIEINQIGVIVMSLYMLLILRYADTDLIKQRGNLTCDM